MVFWALCVIVAGLIISWGCKNIPWPYLCQLWGWDSLTMTFTGKFVLGFLSRTFSIYRTAEEGERYLFNSSLPLPPAAQTLDISRVITAESLPLHIASSQAQTGNLIYTYVILTCIYCIYIYIWHIYIYIYCIYIYIYLHIYIYTYI